MRSKIWAVLAVVALVATTAGGLWWWRRAEAARDDAARAAATAYAKGFTAKDLTGVPLQDPAAAAAFAEAVKGLGDATVTATSGPVTRDGDRATGTLNVTWALPADQTWSYAVPFTLREPDTAWVVATPTSGSLWHPEVKAGDTMSLTRTAATRGDLLDRAGDPLMPLGDVYPVALDPARASSATARELESLVGADKGSLVKALDAAKTSGSQAPIPVITYRTADFEKRRAALDALKGVIYPKTVQPLARTRTFGQPLLGSYGEVTAEIVKESNGRYVAGDRAGLSGLQGQYDEILAGTRGIAVESSTGKVLFDKAAVDGTNVRTTVDPTVQAAAEEALAKAGLKVPGAIVAVDVKTGEVLAAANSPSSGFDRALTGRYAPGSTFKVATTYAYLSRGLTTPNQRVACPASVTVDGRAFRNYAGESISGTPTFSQDFAHSCNTAFIGLAKGLGATDLTKAAAALGIGGDWADRIGVTSTFTGSVPETSGPTDQAAAAIGQGRVEVSPLALAVMAGSVARGNLLEPTLIRSDAFGAPTPKGLDGTATADLRSLMGLVVSEGTGTALRGAAGGQVHAKTGTAEFGTANPPQSRAWLTGYQGEVAFAVLVEEGKSGGTVAAPIAKTFLTTLASTR